MEEEIQTLFRLAFSQDGLLLGIGATIFAVRSWLMYRDSSKAVAELQSTPSTDIADLYKLNHRVLNSDISVDTKFKSPEMPSNLVTVKVSNNTGESSQGGNGSTGKSREVSGGAFGLDESVGDIGNQQKISVVEAKYGVIESFLRSKLNIFGKHGEKELRKSLMAKDRNPVGNPGRTGEELVIVRGRVEPMPDSRRPKMLIEAIRSKNSLDKAVIWEKSQTYVYTEMKNVLGWIVMTQKEPVSTTRTVIDFVLTKGKWPSDNKCVAVSMEGLRHPLPLQQVYSRMNPADISWNTAAVRALLGQPLPVGILDEEKMLKVGTEITAVGSIEFGKFPIIKASKRMPVFLTGLTREELIFTLAHKCKVLFWGSVLISTFAVGVITYSCFKNWRRWKEFLGLRRQQRERNARNVSDAQTRNAAALVDDDQDHGNVPIQDGELCVVCLTRRRRAVFVHCGHRVCCCSCARCIQDSSSPRCPICRVVVTSVYRVFDS